METASSRTLVGHVVVDRGMICVVDPIALSRGDADTQFEGIEKLVQDGSPKAGTVVNGFGVTVGVIVGGFGGDGVYPVYVERDERGLVARCVVEFDPLPPSDVHK